MRITKNFALMYGVLLGDGCLSRVGSARFVSVTCDLHTDKPFFDVIIPILSKLRGRQITIFERPDCGKIEVNFSDKILFNKFKDVGFPVGKKGTNLSIPNELQYFMKEITQGYFATDGCLVITNNNGIVYPRIEFSSISQNLLLQVKFYLDSLNIHGGIYISKRYSNGWNTLYRLQINGKKNLHKFRNHVGLINPKHKCRFKIFRK